MFPIATDENIPKDQIWFYTKYPAYYTCPQCNGPQLRKPDYKIINIGIPKEENK